MNRPSGVALLSTGSCSLNKENSLALHNRRHAKGIHRRRLVLESLEKRSLLAIDLTGFPDWVEQGPGTIQNGNNVEGISNNPQAGAVTALAPDPTNADRLFVASTNGGIWRTTNATAASPHWEPLTDQFPSLSMSAIAFSPLDATQNTLFAGGGRTSSGFGDGGAQIGVLKTTDGGNTWSQIGASLAGNRINQIIPTSIGTAATQVVLAATNNGIFRSTDGGLTFAPAAVLAGNIVDMDADPSNPNRFYASVPGVGFYISTNSGQMWTPINNNISNSLITNSDFVEMAVHNSPGNNVLYAVLFDKDTPNPNPPPPATITTLTAFRSIDQGTTWTPMDNPPQLGIPRHTSIAADPTDPNVVFVSSVVGQDTGNCNRPSGRANRGDASAAAGSQWVQVTCDGANGTSPHPDSRDLEFDANGDLLEASDGGVYRLTKPNTPAMRNWSSVDGDLRTAEFYSIAYDSLNNALFGGTQDNGSPQQTNPGATPGAPPPTFTWTDRTGADGGVAQADNDQTAHPGTSIHYGSEQNLGCFTRKTFDNTNATTDTGYCNVAIGLVVNGTGGMTLTQVEANVTSSDEEAAHSGIPEGFEEEEESEGFADTTIQFIQPYVINAVDGTRMIIGTNYLYESTDRGDTLTALGGISNAGLPPGQFKPLGSLGPVNPSTTYPLNNPIAYGGIANGVPNPAVLWVGAGGQPGGNLYVRTSGTGMPTQIANYNGPGGAGGGTVADIVLDPADWHTAYIVDRNGAVFKAVTDDAGTNTVFTNLTGNLGNFATDLRTIQFVRHGNSAPVLLVGGQGGVYRASNINSSPTWTRLGGNLPNAIAQDLIYDATDDLLAVGTFGRGAWTIADASIVLQDNPVLTICGDENSVNQDDTFRLIREAGNPLLLDVFVNGTLEFTGPLGALNQINVFGVGGNDNLILDSTNGLISVSQGIRYDGDGACGVFGDGSSSFGYDRGFDQLTLLQTGGPVHPSSSYLLGPQIGSGTYAINGQGAGNTQTVYFEELEPVIDVVPTVTHTITATPENNAINYTTGPNSGVTNASNPAGNVTGFVTVDNYESNEFANKTNIVINAGAGSDTINLNNPIIPTGLANIDVHGGDPTEGDQLIVNGKPQLLNKINFMPLSPDSGSVISQGAPGVSFDGIEHVKIDAKGFGELTYTTSGPSGLSYIPGSAPDAGTVTGYGVAGSSLPSLQFSGLGGTNSFSFASDSNDRTNVLDFYGTNDSDLFSVDGSANGELRVLRQAGLPVTVPVGTAGIRLLLLHGLDGDDLFNVDRTTPWTDGLVIDGGNPSASDVANLSDPTAPVTVNVADSSALVVPPVNTTVIGYGGTVTLLGVEKVNLKGVAGSSLTVNGTAADDALTFTPTALGKGSFTTSAVGSGDNSSLFFTYMAFAGSDLTVTGNAGFNQLGLIATAGNDIINAVQTTATHLDFTLNAFTQGFALDNIASANINALSGDDVMRISVADALETAPAGSLQFVVDGGPPNASDRLLVNDDGIGDLTLLRQAPDQRSGSVVVGALNPVSYTNIERLDITPVDPIMGGTGTDGNGRIRVLHSDPFEYNDTRLDSGQLSRVAQSATSPTIDPGALANPFALNGDEDWYEFRPQATGTFQVKVLFDALTTLANGRPGLPGNGDLSLDIYDANGALIVSGAAVTEGKSAIFAATNDPAFPQFNRIFVRVHGATSAAINTYDFDNLTGLGTGNPGVGLVDIFGPQVTNVQITGSPNYNLFGLKPGNAAQGPTPAINSLTISLRDLPNRAPGFLYNALDAISATTPGTYVLKGDNAGIIPITQIILVNNPPVLGQIATATVQLVFAEPLPDDRFTLTINDNLTDPANNNLDGESNAAEPNGAPNFPSGDGHAGSEFMGRFTVDSRAEIGNFSAGSVFVDANGNLQFDPQGYAADATNRDLVFQIGTISDYIFSGKFEPANPALNDNDGFDKLGAFGYDNGAKQYRFLLDFNHDGVFDLRVVSAFQVNGAPVAGNFAPGHNGDEIGLFDGKFWYLDNVGDNQLHQKLASNMQGIPLVGDFNGDGEDDLATYDASLNQFYFDANRDGQYDDTLLVTGPVNGFTERPVTGDFNLDGIDDLGLWVPNRQGTTSPNIAEWYIMVSDHANQALPHNVFEPYAPTPLGNDIFAQFGDYFSLPVVGNFDPPVSVGPPDTDLSTNLLSVLDVNGDREISPVDALLVINQLNTGAQPQATAAPGATPPYMDVNSDYQVSPVDALLIINYLNSSGGSITTTSPDTGAEGEGTTLSDDLLILLATDTFTSKRKSS